MKEECICSPYELLHVRSKSCKYHSNDGNIYAMKTISPSYSEIEISQQSGEKFILSPFEKLLYSRTAEEQSEIHRRLRDGEEIMEILDDMSAG